MDTFTFLMMAGCGLVATTVLWVLGRITYTEYAALMAVLYALAGVVAVSGGWAAAGFAGASWACAVLFAWLWWRGGGGAGTRRRLEAFAAGVQDGRRSVREQPDRPTHPDGTPYGYADMVSEGWEFCDGCQLWTTATVERPHECARTYIKGPFAANEVGESNSGR